MDNNDVRGNEDTLIAKLNKVQGEMPNLVLPSMGIIKNEDDVLIDGKDFIKSKVVKEEQ